MKGTVRKGRQAQALAVGVLRNLGYRHAVEAHPKRMRLANGTWLTLDEDLHGVFDIEAVGTPGVRCVQVTDGGGVKERCDKILAAHLVEPFPIEQPFFLAEVWDVQRRRNVVDPRRVDVFFRVTRLMPDSTWRAVESLVVDA